MNIGIIMVSLMQFLSGLHWMKDYERIIIKSDNSITHFI